MKLEAKFLFIALLAALLSLPVALALQHKTKHMQIEKSENNTLKLKLETKQQELDRKTKQIQLQQKQNDQLKKQLQAKAKIKAKVAYFVAHTSQCAKYRPIVAQYKWDVNVAMAIMKAESNCRAVTPDNSAINFDGKPDYGLMQLHAIPVVDPVANISIAYHNKYLTQGWGAWSTYKNGAYLRYL